MVEMKRGRRAGSNSPLFTPIDGIGNCVGYSPTESCSWLDFVDCAGCEGVWRSTVVGLGRGGRAASARLLFVKIGSAGDIEGCRKMKNISMQSISLAPNYLQLPFCSLRQKYQ